MDVTLQKGRKCLTKPPSPHLQAVFALGFLSAYKWIFFLVDGAISLSQ